MPMTKEAREKIIKMIHDTVDLAAMLMTPEVVENKEPANDTVGTDTSKQGTVQPRPTV